MRIFSRFALLLIALTATTTAAAQIDAKWRPPTYPIPAGTVILAERGVLPDDAEDVADRINAVLATLHAGATLYLQPGTYRIGKTLLIPSGVALQGPQNAGGRPLSALVQVRPFGKWGPLNLGLL